MQTVRIGVLGAGRIGWVHAENAAFRVPGAEVVAVADLSLEAAQRCAKHVRASRASARSEEILESRDIDAVVIATSTDTHAHLISQAAQGGKHVFCEKPIDLDLARLDSALADVKRAGVLFQIGFQRRFDPSFLRARELIQSGRIGRPHVVRMTSRDPRPPSLDYVKVSGGLFADMTIHDFDVARWIVGREIDELFVQAANFVDPAIGEQGDVDTALLSLRYTDGTLCSIDNSRQALYGYDIRLEVFGSEGMVQVGNVPQSEVTVSGTSGVRSDGPMHWFIQRFERAYVNELRHFVDCVRTNTPPSVGAEDGRAPLLLAKAAKTSLLERRLVTVER